MVVVPQGDNKVRKIVLMPYLVRDIKRGKPDILVCTPGRLIDLLQNEGLSLQEVGYQILDEGDKMLDMGFEQDIIEIQKHLREG
jgi:superfamily II DNA/RNA helicase